MVRRAGPNVLTMDVGPSGQSARPVPRVERRPALPIGVYGPRGLALRCAVDGRDAGRSGEPVTVCPYLPDSRPLETKWWVRGYVAGLRDAGLPTAADRIDEWDEDAPWPGDDRETVDEPSCPAGIASGRLPRRRASCLAPSTYVDRLGQVTLESRAVWLRCAVLGSLRCVPRQAKRACGP